MNKYKAALFDLDGVVFDTEPQYSIFWGSEFKRYYPDSEGMEQKIKGQTLDNILSNYFADFRDEWSQMIERLDAYESNMDYIYVPGFEDYIKHLRKQGLKTAVVTSSNKPKMDSVKRVHPELNEYFDCILMSEDFEFSKPHPDCYLKGAARFGARPEECLVFEDSINGLKSGRASGGFVVGLSTGNPAEVIAPLCDIVIPDYTSLPDCLV